MPLLLLESRRVAAACGLFLLLYIDVFLLVTAEGKQVTDAIQCMYLVCCDDEAVFFMTGKDLRLSQKNRL